VYLNTIDEVRLVENDNLPSSLAIIADRTTVTLVGVNNAELKKLKQIKKILETK